MLAKLNTFALVGIDAVRVEVDAVAGNLPKTVLVGLPELAVRESIHRIERTLCNLRYRRPTGRTIINLAPADLRKDAGRLSRTFIGSGMTFRAECCGTNSKMMSRSFPCPRSP